MAALISASFVPVKIHIKEQPQTFERFNAHWTPTQLILDSEGIERHRLEGFLPKEDFLAQLELGLARVEFEHKRYVEAERRFRAVAVRYPESAAAPEAVYWAGVSAYKTDPAGGALRRTTEALQGKYPQSEWARKASVWAG